MAIAMSGLEMEKHMPGAKSPLPKALRSEGEALVIDWDDGAQHRLPWTFIREQCPCATCRAEREAESSTKTEAADNPLNILDQATAEPPRPVDMRPVGNYAYGIEFNDGHNTGSYSLEYLRFLGEHRANG